MTKMTELNRLILPASQDDLKQADCGNSQSDFMEGISGHGDVGEMAGDVSNPWVLVMRKTVTRKT
jgi:hypothetical protein